MRTAALLFVVLVIVAGFAVPGIRRGIGRFLRRSSEQSPAALSTIERSRWRLLTIVLWFASVTSLVEMAYRTYGKEITGYSIISSDYRWQVPAGYFLIFLPIALLALRPSRRALSAIVLLCSFVCTLAVLPIAFKGLYTWAAVMLSAGIALQVMRAWRAHA